MIARLALLLAAVAGTLAAADANWTASWITHPAIPLREPAVVHFRRDFRLPARPDHFIVHVSADNRFILYVNGARVGDGPARGDLSHWRYETFDLAAHLKDGDNVIAATVWNFGIYAPIAQISDRTAFVLQGEGDQARPVSTPNGWLVEIEHGQSPIPRKAEGSWEYMACGPGELLDASAYDWEWSAAKPGPRGAWVKPASPMRESIYPTTGKAALRGTQLDNYWQLVPDMLPAMEFAPTAAGRNVRSDALARSFPAAAASIPAHSHVHVLLDRGTLTTAYPALTVSGGKGSTIRLTYAEALYDEKHRKGDRDEAGNRRALGLRDSFLPDGGAHRVFEPLWWRTWRYLDLDVETTAEPLTIESLTANFTAYPFEARASFHSDDEDLQRIWDISWRTAQLDAHETYMDTPYWEQLQYIGDTRIQALISYTLAGDDRLARQAIAAFDESRIPDGLTQSRYPTSQPQFIPTFSLLWIGMLHDYWMYRPDPAPVRDALPGTRAVLAWFRRHEQPDGLLEKLPWWSFVDWVSSGEIPTYSASGESCTTTLMYLGALDDAAQMERALGDEHFAREYTERAAWVRPAIRAHCWDADRKMLADNPDRKNFSQQTNVLGVLYDAVPLQDRADLLHRMLAIQPGSTPGGVLSASYYFRFYLSRAVEHTDLGDEYLASLAPWRALLPLHFSTWPETPGETRSDSHAWSAHPIYDLLTLVAGIAPASPGFSSVRIAPHPGPLRSIAATFPHPKGAIAVQFEHSGSQLNGTVTLPEGLRGTFVWHGASQSLHAGANAIGPRPRQAASFGTGRRRG
jgi:hypothetical protein